VETAPYNITAIKNEYFLIMILVNCKVIGN
jgi:hypothetical protein